MLWTCEIYGAQHMIFTQKIRFSRPQGQLDPARAQPAQQKG